MGPTGRLVTIKRSGVDGPHFPLSLSTCLFGRGIECDIRIQLPVVSKQHCKIEISGQEAILFNFSSTNPTQVNGSVIAQPVQLKHGDVITIVDRSFRYENENHQNGSESTEFLGQKRKQESLHRVSRSSFSSDPDGKVQDSNARSKFSEENVSGGPLVHVKHGKAAGTVSDGLEDHTASKTLNGVHSSELPGENYRNAMDPTAGDLEEDSSGPLVSCNGELKSFPSTCCPENSENHQSPFRKLYESMKEEFDVKSEKGNVLQSGRKSGSRSHRTSENECSGGLQDGTQVLVSLKSRPRSGRFTPIKANPALGEQGISRTEDRKGEEAVEMPKETMGPSIPPKEVTRTKTLVQHSPHNSSRKRRSEDVRVPSGSESVSLDQREAVRTDNQTSTPRKFLTRNQTPTKVENADNLGATPEKHFSRKRGSVPTGVDIPATEPETQNHTVLAPLPVQVERKIQGVSGHQPEKVGAPAGHLGSGFLGHSSVDSGHSGDSINKIEGTPLKRRRVSFGGRLKPELFDENLPPNTPLKRGETPRRSLVSHPPPVLKKIIKEYPQPSRKEDSSEIRLEATAPDQCTGSPAPNPPKTSPVANDTRRRSCKVSAVSSGSKSPHHTDVPKRGARKSGSVPSKRTSIDRSQHEILQRIYSKRRSGASEANLIVAKSWADVVKLGAKQTQARVVKRGPQRQLSKRHRRANTPQKPVRDVHNQFSTGHANSPCTIIIGKAHTEKVHVPTRPYRMLNNFAFSKKMDFNEDLSGLTEMFKTPAKMKPQALSLCPNAFSKSEDFLGKKPSEVPNSGEKPLLCTSENFGETIFPMTQKAPQEPSDQSPVCSALRRPAIRVNLNIEKTPGSEAEPPNKFRRSAELRNTQMPGPGPRDEEANTDTAENTSGQRLRKTPQRRQRPEGATEEWESCFEACEKPVKSEDCSEKTVDMRRSRRYSEQKWKPIADLTTLKRQQDTEPKEDLGGMRGLSQTPSHTQELMDVGNKTAEKCQKSSKPESVGMPTRMNIQLETSPQKVDLEEEPSSLRKPTHTLGESIPSHREPGDGDEDMKWFNRTPKQSMDSAENVTGSKRLSRTPKRNVQSLEDLAGLRELFQTPNHTDKPTADDKTTKVPCKSPLADPVNTPTSRKWQLETLPQNVDLDEDPSALRKPTRTPRTAVLSYREPGGDGEDIKLFKETPKQKLNPAENITGSRRRPRIPKKMVHSLEDLVGLKELFQTPEHTQDPVTNNKTTKAPCKSPVAEPVNTSTNRRRQLKTAAQKVDLEEEPSALRKPIRTAGESGPLHGEPEGGNEDIKLFNRTPKQKVDSAENVTGSKRRSRTPRRNVQSLEDLAGLRELFRTPNHTDKPMVDDKTTKVPCKSPLAKPVNTPTSRRRQLETPGQKVDLEEEPSALREPIRTAGESGPLHGEPEGGNEDIKLFNRTPKQKVDSAENVTGSKRRSRTPRRNVQSLEDLAGLRELFRTPNHTDKPMVDDKTTKVPCKSPLAKPVNTPTSRRRQLETPGQKVDLEEDLGKATQTPGESTDTHREPGGGDEDIRLFKDTPKQKLNPADNVTGSKRQSRTPKKNAQSLEDLAGLRELFQTPEHTQDPMTDDKTTKVPCKSPLAEPVNTPTSRRRQLETSRQKVDLEEEPSSLRKPTQTPGESIPSHREPGDGDEDTKWFNRTPKQSMDSAENVTGSKRLSRTPKRNAQSLEELAGLRELFQTPEHTQDPMTDDKTTKVPCKSPLVDPVNTPTSRRRQLETSRQKVDLEEEPSALREPTRTPGESTHSHTEPGGGDEDVGLFRAIPQQKLDTAENVSKSKRQSRTPKKNPQSLEDLAGLRELFQTPEHTDKPTADDKTTKVPCKSPLADPVNTPTSRRRQLETPGQKADLEEDFRKPTQTPGESTDTHREPGGGDEDRLFKAIPQQKLDAAENVSRSKRQSRTPKKNAQSLEDLAGLRELFQTPEHTDKPTADDKTTKVPCKSPLSEPVSTPSRKRQLKTPLQKVDLEEEPLALRKPTRTPRKTTLSYREPGGGAEDIHLFKETPEKKLDHVENVTGSKKWIRTSKEKAQFLGDMVGFKELFQTPEHTNELTAVVQTAVTPCKSPLAETVNTPTHMKRCLKIPLGKMDLEKELSPLRKPTQTPRGATHTYTEPGGGDEAIRQFKETPKQKLNPAENITGSRMRPRTPKKMVHSLEDLVGLKELFQTPEHTQDLVTDNKTTKVPCKSPVAEPVNKPMSRRRRLKPSPQQADTVLEPSALRKSTRTRGRNTQSLREPGGADEENKLLNKTAKQKLNSAENVTGSRRQSRTAKKNAQSLEDPAGLRELFQTPEHTQDLVTDDKTTKVPCKSPLAEPVNKPTSRSRRLKPSPQQAGAAEEPSALRKSTRTRGRNTQSLREPGGADEDITSLNETAKQKLSPADNITLRKNRLRAPKEEAQPQEDLARLKESSPGQDRSKEPGKDPGSIEGAPEQTPDRRKPVEVLRRGLRAPRVIAVDDLGAHREPVESESKGSISLPSKRKRGTEGGLTGTKRLGSATPAQGATEEKPPQKRRRTTPTEGCGPPEPLTAKKRMRVVAERMELLGDPPRSRRETKARGREAGRTTPPHQGMSLRSRRPNKTEMEEEGPEPVLTAGEKPKTKTSDKKPLMTSKETMLQTPEDGAKNLTSGGKAPESRMRLRSTRPSKMPSPDIAEEKQREKRAGVHRKKQEEEVKQPSDPVRLRSRKITVPPGGNAFESEPQQRVTRSVKRSAENIKKDNDNVCVKKLRTRSRRDNEDI
ncbi:proliferation marker protein Ki-67 [Ailuropoda melanoleuca]|uniref:Marker of proliferation Ki-67 n=1 Tax=Ailuropoda melanoleuca TaxID=9646 RepID=G1L017_AILME|nr:proliferation marker protein Ki-67 [Ailuropoda melanoleuca]XP_034519323.1 proliferation marker protein Ki-67 [Ailuropoda melanoleuca]XP_034519324.1 proliferation marker protein Ki-67 [Ailuropoda melanoleuca]